MAVVVEVAAATSRQEYSVADAAADDHNDVKTEGGVEDEERTLWVEGDARDGGLG